MMAYATFNERQTMRDLLVAWTLFSHERPLDVLRRLKRERGETRV